MKEADHSQEKPTLEATQRLFEHWRENRPKARSRIPPELWQTAINQIGPHSLNEVSRALRLSYTDLKKRSEAQSSSAVPVAPPATPRFVELTWNKPPIPVSECKMEVENREGKKLTLTIRNETAGLNAIALAKGLWELTS